MASFRSAPWEAFCLQGVLLQTPVSPSKVSVLPEFMCATFKACEMLPRSAPNLSLVNLPHLLLCPNTSSSEVCTDICDYFCSSPLHTFFPDCLGNSQYPVRGSPSVNFSKLNPTQGVHLSTCPERLSSRPWTCSRCPGAWPSLAAHYAEAPQRAVCAANNLCHNVGRHWAAERGLATKTSTLAIAGNGHKAAGLSQTQLWLPAKWKL